MEKLLIKYRFQGMPFIVADGKGEFYQLPHCLNNYTKSFRKLELVLNNNVTEGYRIDRKFISLKQLRQRAYKSSEVMDVSPIDNDLPF
jgi:hypothetical protein